MPEYEFHCRHCQKTFALIMRISERGKTAVRCPECGSEDVEVRMQAFVAKTARKS